MGMTNGEMIQKIFNCEVCEPIPEDDTIHVIFADKKQKSVQYRLLFYGYESCSQRRSRLSLRSHKSAHGKDKKSKKQCKEEQRGKGTGT